MRSDTACFSAAVIGRRFLSGLASDLLSAGAAGFLVEEDRREGGRGDGGADAPRICSTSVNALISAWRRSISLWRSAMACAMSLMRLESSGPGEGDVNQRGGGDGRSPKCVARTVAAAVGTPTARGRGRRPSRPDGQMPLAELRALRAEYQAWRDHLPDPLGDSRHRRAA